MKSTLASALLASLVGLVPTLAQAEWLVPHRSLPRRLPPVSGTIRVDAREFGHGRGVFAPLMPRIVTGTGSLAYRYGPAYGDQSRAFQQLAAADRRASVSWRGDGTGLVGLIPDRGGSRYVAEAPVEVSYGEPVLWGRAPVPPTGGLAYYGSGSAGRMSTYSSGSSAGPYGSAGGLATYSSGSYGPGPAIISVSRARGYPGYGYGPKIITRGSRGRYANW